MEQPQINDTVNQLDQPANSINQPSQIKHIIEETLPAEPINVRGLRSIAIGLIVVSMLQISHLVYGVLTIEKVANPAEDYLIAGGTIAIQAIIAIALLVNPKATYRLYKVVAWVYVIIGAVMTVAAPYWLPVSLMAAAFSSSDGATAAQINSTLFVASIVLWAMGLFVLSRSRSTIADSPTPQQNQSLPQVEAPKKSD
ncbi:MAG: hypothetical protein WBB94_02960 [Candidatus Saccharimonadaceae bacterium]